MDPANLSSYVAVHGYLYSNSVGTANIVATLVSVADMPTGSSRANFKAEGPATVTSGSVTVGGLSIDLSKAKCFAAGKQTTACSFNTGDVIAVGSAVAPSPPTSILVADFARLASKTSVETGGAAVEMEGVVSSVTATGFVVRGVTIDTSALATATTPPQVGDVVRVLGAVAGSGQTVTASSFAILHAAASVKLGLEGDASAVVPGTVASTYTLSVLGQTVTVNAQTRLMDMSQPGWDHKVDPAANPFNISTFATYLGSSGMSQHLIIKAETDASHNLVANSLAIVPASTLAGVAGLVDATPPVVNSTGTGTASTLSVNGISISVDPAAVRVPGRQQPASIAIAAGDQVVALGIWNGSTLTIGAKFSGTNQLFDAGAPKAQNKDRGEF
jgi:hypothetical protein